MDLLVQKEVKETTTVLHLKGTLDITTTHLIEPHLQEIEEDMQLLIFDFAMLDFMDSTGVGSIINAIHLTQEKQFQLKFQGVNEITDQVFDLMGIYKILEAIQGEVV